MLSASDGKVIDRWNYELGQGVRIETIVNGITYEVGYNHLATVEPNIIRGAIVQRGTKLGMAGETGAPGLLHLHFDVTQGVLRAVVRK